MHVREEIQGVFKEFSKTLNFKGFPAPLHTLQILMKTGLNNILLSTLSCFQQYIFDNHKKCGRQIIFDPAYSSNPKFFAVGQQVAAPCAYSMHNEGIHAFEKIRRCQVSLYIK